MIQGKRMMCECCLYPNRGEKPKTTQTIFQWLNSAFQLTRHWISPRSSSIKDVKNLRKVKSVQIKHRRGISFKQFIQRVTGVLGVVIMWSCVCLSMCVWKSFNASAQATAVVQWTERDGKYCWLCKASGLCSFEERIVKCLLTNSTCCLYSCLL